MQAASFRAQVGLAVRVEHGTEKCRGEVVADVDGIRCVQSLRIVRFKNCNVNEITLLPAAAWTQYSETEGWKCGSFEFAGRPFEAEDVTECCTLQRSCFVPVKFISKTESDSGEPIEVRSQQIRLSKGWHAMCALYHPHSIAILRNVPCNRSGVSSTWPMFQMNLCHQENGGRVWSSGQRSQ